MYRQSAFTPRRLAVACAAALSAGLAGHAHAAGFALIEQSVVSMGTAYAGAAALAQDPATVYFNPAGMALLPGSQIAGAIHLVFPHADFRDDGSVSALGAPLGSNESGDAGVHGLVPNVYLTHQFSDQLTAGLGINAPFGLSTEYDDDWIGRYHAIDSDLKTININPAIAFKVNDMFSVGLGINLQYIEADLSNAIDIGTINVLPPPNGFGGALPLAGPGRADGKVELEGDDWSWGWNLGALVSFTPETRLGLHYRSKVEHTLEGDADFSIPFQSQIEAATGGLFADTGVKSSVDLPATASASLFHQINPELAVMADVTWTEWSNIEELRFEFDNPLQADGVTTLKWDDTFRYSLGASYAPADSRWTFRAGLAYDEAAATKAEYRTPRIPDEDRTWVAFGASYQLNDKASVDFGYSHLFVDDPEIDKDPTDPENLLRGGLKGSYDASVDLVAVQVRTRF